MSNAGVIIAGAAETDEIGRLPNTSTLGLHIEAARNAVADAGLTMKDIDGIATVSSPGPVQVAHALGIYPDWVDGTGVGRHLLPAARPARGRRHPGRLRQDHPDHPRRVRPVPDRRAAVPR